jgi:hypothetical protein
VRIPKKRTGTYYAKLVFLHAVGYAGHKVLSVASESRNCHDHELQELAMIEEVLI